MIFIGFEIRDRTNCYYISKAIVEKMSEAALVSLDSDEEYCLAYSTVCDLLDNGLKIWEISCDDFISCAKGRESIQHPSNIPVSNVFKDFISTLDLDSLG